MDVLVLIVDDNERNARLVRDVLERAGMRTIVAGTAKEGIAAARSDQPDVVLMDLQLPDLDGTTAATLLAGDPTTTGIPVVALTAVPSNEWVPDPAFAGYLEKPIDVLALPGQVHRHCRS